MIASLVLLAAVSLPDVSAVVGQPKSTPLSGSVLVARTEALANSIRCPVCQGSSVGDSPSEMARNMKQQVKELLSLGFDNEQIITYFEASYGEFIRLEPRKEGLNLLVWIAPIGALLLGIILLVIRLKPGVVASDDALPSATQLPSDPVLASWVLKVRHKAYGWRDGQPPEEVG
jgi:cytochrome c-type biogenesis protein CcmH